MSTFILPSTDFAEPPHRVIFDDLNYASGQRLKHSLVSALSSQGLAFPLPQAQLHLSYQTKHFSLVPRAALGISRGFCGLFERTKNPIAYTDPPAFATETACFIFAAVRSDPLRTFNYQKKQLNPYQFSLARFPVIWIQKF